MNEQLGVESSKKCDKDIDPECEEKLKKKEKRRLQEDSKSKDQEEEPESEMNRLGSVNFIENMGIMLLFAFFLLIVCGCVLMIAIAVRYIPEATSTYEKIKNNIFWNAFIRYAF